MGRHAEHDDWVSAGETAPVRDDLHVWSVLPIGARPARDDLDGRHKIPFCYFDLGERPDKIV